MIYTLILINIFVTSKYHQRFNVERKFMELEKIDKSNLVKAKSISPYLDGLQWQQKKMKKD